MKTFLVMTAMIGLCVATGLAHAENPDGLLAEWNFDDGPGPVIRDASGHGHDARAFGADRAPHGAGYALRLDGVDDYVDCGESQALGIGGPITIEAWVKPMRKANGEAALFGENYSTYFITYYNTEVACWYTGSGGNSQYGKLTLNEWNHVVATFDGKALSMWVNGQLAGTRPTRHETYTPSGRFLIGTKDRPDLPRFKGLVDRVRVYNRALPATEAIAHFKAEASEYGYDPTWFSRVKVTPYYYFDRNEIVVTADYRGLLPLHGTGKVQVSLAPQGKTAQPNWVRRGLRRIAGKPAPVMLEQHDLRPAPATGMAEVHLSTDRLKRGRYTIRVHLEDDAAAWPVEEVEFLYPPASVELPAPSEQTVAPLSPRAAPTPFSVTVGKGGGFRVALNGSQYDFESRVSWPNGRFNRLSAGDVPSADNEAGWTVSVRGAGEPRCDVEASGASYVLHRRIEVHPTHVYVTDTYSNTTAGDLGLMIYNETPVTSDKVIGSWLSGHERRGRAPELTFPDYGPSVFFTDANTGMGLVPVDDVYVVHAVPYVDWEGAAGVGTEKFALAPGASYTLEWAVYPTGSKDYYDFINTFRTVEGRIATVSEVPGFISWGPNNRRQVPDKAFVDKRGMTVGILSCLSFTEDDPELSIEGIEFLDFPKEMQLLKDQSAAIHRNIPGFKVVFHIAHTLYATNKPDQVYPDSRVILADGKHGYWDGSGYFSKERIAQGWQWWAYYPTPGNAFHEAMLKSVDVMMDDLGYDGAFLDGFLAGYVSQWTYDRWDGHSAEIDPATKTLKRKMGSVILLSQPSMIEYTRKIRDKGGVVIANNTVFTRTICNEKYILFDLECASGPQQHLAPNVMALASPPFGTEKDIYLDMLDKLSWGELFLYYNERIEPAHPSLAARQFPITFEEIRAGLVRGRERIVTMNSGVYGWEGSRRLHRIYKFDDRGAPSVHDFVTTVDAAGVRTELKLKKNESAVIEPLPLRLEADGPMNVRVIECDAGGLRMLLNGRGDAVVRLFVGAAYPDKRDGIFKDGGVNPRSINAGTDFRVTSNGEVMVVRELDGSLRIPLALNGATELRVERVTP